MTRGFVRDVLSRKRRVSIYTARRRSHGKYDVRSGPGSRNGVGQRRLQGRPSVVRVPVFEPHYVLCRTVSGAARSCCVLAVVLWSNAGDCGRRRRRREAGDGERRLATR